jgi:hypothetical protein
LTGFNKHGQFLISKTEIFFGDFLVKFLIIFLDVVSYRFRKGVLKKCPLALPKKNYGSVTAALASSRSGNALFLDIPAIIGIPNAAFKLVRNAAKCLIVYAVFPGKPRKPPVFKNSHKSPTSSSRLYSTAYKRRAQGWENSLFFVTFL